MVVARCKRGIQVNFDHPKSMAFEKNDYFSVNVNITYQQCYLIIDLREQVGYSSKLVCKGICIRHKALKPIGVGRYLTGQKRCQVCEIFITWDGLWCPCCGYRLRTRPRNLKYKVKLRERELRKKQEVILKVQKFTPKR